MAGISPATLERIRAASDIVDVIGACLPLKKAGANFTALCPFHKEKTPSFNVNPHRQIFHCFGCHKGGDVFTFVKEYENIGFVDAVRRLAERAKIPLEFDSRPGEQQSRHLKDQLLQIHDQIAQRWQNCLANEAAGQLARDYLKKRGVSAEAVKLFRLGAAPDLWDDTVNWAKSKKYELEIVEKAGLVIKKAESGNEKTIVDGPQTEIRTPHSALRNYYDRFRGRLMFPICDEQGRVIGFSGRVLSGDEKTAKYVNSPETPIFTKSKVFFGLDKSKRAILDAGFAIVCEGQLDLIACFMAGVQNVVAPQGTAFTDQHARIIKRYVNEVVLCFDSDNAGQKAASRSLDILFASGLSISVATLPAPHDPDSFIKQFGGGAFQEKIETRLDFFEFYLNHLCTIHDIKTDKEKILVAKEMGEVLRRTNADVLVDLNAQRTSNRLGISLETVRGEFKKVSGTKMEWAKEDVAEAKEESEEIKLPVQEFWLLKLLLLHDNLAAWAALHLDVNWISHPGARQVVEQRLAAQADESWKGPAVFLDACGSAEMRSLVTEAAAEDRKIPNPEQQLADVALKLRNQFLDRQIAALTQKVSQPGFSEAEQNELLQKRETLRGQKRAPLAALN